jgi:hypothetical protein
MNKHDQSEKDQTVNSQPVENTPASADNFVVHTSQEIDALGRATANGKTFNGYQSNAQGGTVTFSLEQLAHSVQLSLDDDERIAGVDVSYLENLVRAQDSDAVIAQLYILSVLAPPAPVSGNFLPKSWIDIDDVIEKIGWDARSTEQRMEMRSRIWEFIKYGARAKIVGQRSIPYVDRKTGETIDTAIFDTAWHLGAPQGPEQRTLGFIPEIPVRIELILSTGLTALITSPLTAQYLPLGEVLGSIPGGKAAGAWARVLGLALASFWRRNPVKSLNGEIKPSRIELLDHYPAKVSPYQEVFQTNKHGRVIEHWVGAMNILKSCGIIAAEGEALRTEQDIRSSLPPRGWQEKWLQEKVSILPGAEMREHIEGRIRALPSPPVKRKMGRPRKSR